LAAPVVVIEMAEAERGDRLALSMVEACSHGVGGACTLEGASAPSEPTAVAIVVWDGPVRRSAKIEVGLWRAERAQWRTQSIDFRPEDEPRERWRSVGLVVATLVGETVRAAAAAAPVLPPPLPEPAPAPTPESAPRPPPPTTSPKRVILEGGALAGPGLDSGPWRVGGFGRGAYRIGDLPLAAVASLRYARRPSDSQSVSVGWATAGVGAEGVFAVSTFFAELSAEWIVEWIRASVDSGGGDHASRTVSGGRLGLGLGTMPLPWLGFVVGFDETLVGGQSSVTVRGAPVGVSQTFESTGFFGVRFTF